MKNEEWRDASTLPKNDGRYLVRFYFPYRHPTDRTEIAIRNYKNGKWEYPYYSYEDEDSELCQWKPM